MRGSSVLFLAAVSGAMPNMAGLDQRFDNAIVRLNSNGMTVSAARLQEHTQRFDSVVRELRAQNPGQAFNIDSALKKAARAANLREDAFSASAGLHMARQLEHIYAEVLREPFPVQNSWTLFPIDSSVPPGARTHTVRRVYQDGDAAVYRGGQTPIPRVGVSQQEEQFPVRHYVTSFVYTLFEQISSAFANSGLIAELLRAARDIIMEFANQKTWYGDATNGIYGVLNYPWLPVKVVSTPFDGSADVDDVLAEMNSLANFPQENSKSTFRPDTVVVSPRVYNYLFNTRLGTVNDTTIGEFWLRTNSCGITKIEQAWEIQGVGPGGTDGILFYLKNRLGIVNVIPQGFTTLPVQALGFEYTTFAYMSHGGVLMRDVGNNILGWVDAEA